ncbi:hypothetical protein QAD02_009679 [Eretmocerus hayati]|uniref:Uncharacterized protein n=1 Tax=Eretmocerus hayati TaxID=131215 RepID=A0ACC2NAE4_9HYME|nr:hypothetical protein QAD02_009679 [Eretmocerus hayati]
MLPNLHWAKFVDTTFQTAFRLAGIEYDTSDGLPTTKYEETQSDVLSALVNHYPEIPRIKVEGKSACSGIFLRPRIVLTDSHCVGNSTIFDIKVKLRQGLDQENDAVYDIRSTMSLICSDDSIECAMTLLLLKNSAEGAKMSNLSQNNDGLPQIGQSLSLISWDTSVNDDVSGKEKKGLLRSVNLTVELSSMDCAKKLNVTLGDGEIICAKITSGTKLPKKIMGGPVMDSNGTVVGIAAFPKKLDNGEVLIVSTAVATQRESINDLRQLMEEHFSLITTTPSSYLSLTPESVTKTESTE